MIRRIIASASQQMRKRASDTDGQTNSAAVTAMSKATRLLLQGDRDRSSEPSERFGSSHHNDVEMTKTDSLSVLPNVVRPRLLQAGVHHYRKVLAASARVPTALATYKLH